MGWVWEDEDVEGPHTEEEIQYFVGEMFHMQKLMAGLVSDLLLHHIDDYAKLLAIIDGVEEVDTDEAIESMCENLFDDLEKQMKAIVKAGR